MLASVRGALKRAFQKKGAASPPTSGGSGYTAGAPPLLGWRVGNVDGHPNVAFYSTLPDARGAASPLDGLPNGATVAPLRRDGDCVLVATPSGLDLGDGGVWIKRRHCYPGEVTIDQSLRDRDSGSRSLYAAPGDEAATSVAAGTVFKPDGHRIAPDPDGKPAVWLSLRHGRVFGSSTMFVRRALARPAGDAARAACDPHGAAVIMAAPFRPPPPAPPRAPAPGAPYGGAGSPAAGGGVPPLRPSAPPLPQQGAPLAPPGGPYPPPRLPYPGGPYAPPGGPYAPRGGPSAPQGAPPAPPQPAPPPPPAPEECCVCMSAESCIVLTKCFHCIICAECAQTLKAARAKSHGGKAGVQCPTCDKFSDDAQVMPLARCRSKFPKQKIFF